MPVRPELSDDEGGPDARTSRKRIDHEIAELRVTPRHGNLRQLDRTGEDHEGGEVPRQVTRIAEAGEEARNGEDRGVLQIMRQEASPGAASGATSDSTRDRRDTEPGEDLKQSSCGHESISPYARRRLPRA